MKKKPVVIVTCVKREKYKKDMSECCVLFLSIKENKTNGGISVRFKFGVSL